MDLNYAYYDIHSFRYGPKRRQELVFRLDTPRGGGAWQKISVDTPSCLGSHTYLWPGVHHENADLQRRLANFEGLHRIVQGLDKGEIQVYRQGVHARRYAQALRDLAARSSDQGFVRAYTAYADAIDQRVAVGVMERGFFFKADRQAFFAALPKMSAERQKAITSRIARESWSRLKKPDYAALSICYSDAISRMRAISFSNEPMAERQRLLTHNYSVAAELLDELIEPASIDPEAAERMRGLLREWLQSFVAMTPPQAECDLKYYDAPVGYGFASPECARKAHASGIGVNLVSQSSQTEMTIPLKVVTNGGEFQLTG